MSSLTLTLTAMANGGAALGRDESNRVVFVPFAIPGERVRVTVVEDRPRFARAQLEEVLAPSPERIEARCPHFGPCGGCHFQHIRYEAQLQYKTEVLRDQLQRIGGFDDPPIEPLLPNTDPWSYSNVVTYNVTQEGRLGFWSPREGQVIPIETCHIIRPELLALYQDVDLELPGLRQLALRVGADGELLAALMVEGDEPPALESDFPLSVVLLLPDGSAVNLIGDNYVVQTIAEWEFRVSAGCFFYPDAEASAVLMAHLVKWAGLSGRETVLELYSGVGAATAFLAEEAAEVVAVEVSGDAVADAAYNLAAFDNVSLYEGAVEEVLPLLDLAPELIVMDPPDDGLSPAVMDDVQRLAARRVIYISSDVATLARDGRRLAAGGYQPLAIQPLDMYPQTYRLLTVSVWQRADQ
ncbi:MAG: TRAM domain-containing protein [Candidatus Promineifilaceae bacterium]|nr:TRAM domain-containing protein [Candidatus Promineifilaceae bacterium]